MILEGDDWETNSVGSSEKGLALEMATERPEVEGKSRRCRGMTPEAQDLKAPIARTSLLPPLCPASRIPRGGRGESHDREAENIPCIVLRPQLVVVEGSEGGWGVGQRGGEVNKIKKAIIRPQYKPYNYAPKFNQNSFPHWACNYLTSPVRFCLPGPSLEIPQIGVCRARLKGRACLSTTPTPPTP